MRARALSALYPRQTWAEWTTAEIRPNVKGSPKEALNPHCFHRNRQCGN